MEELRSALCRLMSSNPLPPFRSETVVVSSQGMERWLAMGIARELGVAANVEFPFPRAFVEHVLDLASPELAGACARFSRESLRWALLGLIPELAAHPSLGPVRAYVEADERGDKLAGFADRVAHLFDQYAVYRPELALEWEASGGEGWQPVLWRALVERLGSVHVAARARDFLRRFPAQASLDGLPPRVCLFGTATLPPVFVQILAALAQRIDVHAFLLCPADTSWRATAGRRAEIRRSRGRAATRPSSGLGAAFGRVERDFQEVLETHVDYVDAGDARFVDPGDGSVLAVLQSDLLHARARAETGERVPLSGADGSLSIHVCHSPMRELEVLRDQLLAAFHDDPTLGPEDVIVMMPDVETYGPYVDAVFGSEPEGRGFIPYRLTDRAQRRTCPLAEALLAVLRSLGGRFSAPELTDLLQLEPVQRRFGFDPRDLPRLEAWIRASGARSFFDPGHRRELGLEPTLEHTWRFGLNRLLLGYALPGQSATLFQGALPLDAVEGGGALAAGQLAELVETLGELRQSLSGKRSVAAWRDAVGSVLARTLSADGADAWQERVVREALDGLVEAAERVGFVAAVERSVFERALEEALDSQRSSHDFLAGGVTFSALLPMRSIPFRVVCLVGMNDGEFPRSTRGPAFDEMAKNPRVGDRSVRDDDRHSFLEALLSARERLIVTYVGKGIQDDGVRPPSVVLSELCETVDATFDAGQAPGPGPAQLSLAFEGKPPPKAPTRASSALVVEHPLQAFSPRYFGADEDPRLFSYSKLELEGAKARAAAAFAERRTFTAPLAAAPETDVDLDELCAFFEHPVRKLFERECAVRARQDVDLLPEREPIQLGDLDRYQVGSFLLERELDGAGAERSRELAQAAGLLPHGTLGRVAHARESRDVGLLCRESRAETAGGRLRAELVELELGGRRLTGVLRDLYAKAQVIHTFSRSKAKMLLSLWIRHLALAASARPELPRRSVLVARGRQGPGVERWELGPVEPELARERLSELLELRELGRRQPLCFFPDAALAYVEKLCAAEGSAQKALAAARASWSKGQAHSGADDPYHRHLFGERDPLAPDFELVPGLEAPRFDELARRVLAPAWSHFERARVRS